MSEIQLTDVGTCELHSEQSLNVGSSFKLAANEQARVSFLGDVTFQDNTLSAQELLDNYLQTKDLHAFYQELSGRFFIVIQDLATKSVHLFNDFLGMVPCYYRLDNKELSFSTSLKTLKKEVSGEYTVSKQAIYNYIYFHCIPSPTTIYQEVAKLEPGKLVSFDEHGNKSETTLYSPQFETKPGNEQALHQECLSVIEKAVSDQITDDNKGNCGAFLSGGLDSSTVAGMLAKVEEPAKTFSIGFDAEGYDETEYALITSKHFGTQHEVLYLQSEQAAEKFVEVAQYFDEPFGNSSAMAAYFCAMFAKGHGVNTLLAGDGGDELFAGNDRYAKQKVFELWSSVPAIAKGLIKPVASVTSSMPVAKKAASYISQAEIPLPDRLQSYNFVYQLGREQIFESEFLQGLDTELPEKQLRARYHDCKSENPVDRMLYLDWKFTLADNDLVKVNKMCEFAGVDVHFPLLEKSVVDFSCKVTAEQKLPGQKLRHFYKESCRGFLADDTLTKSKHGFGLPFGVWLKENPELNKTALQALEKFKQRKIVTAELVDKAIAAHNSVHAGYFGELIWIMVVLELWLQGNEDDAHDS